MKPSICAVLSTAALLVAAAPTQVLAADATCLWDHLPPQTTSAIIEAGLKQDLGKIHDAGSDAGPAAKACGLEKSAGEDVGNALTGVALERVGEAWFQRNLGVGPDRLDTAWGKLGPKMQSALEDDIQSPKTDEALVSGATDAFITALGMPTPKDDHASADLGYFSALYLGGRSLRAAMEPKL